MKKVVGPEGQIELKNDVISVPVGEPSDGSDANASSSRRRHMVREALRQSIAARRAAGRAQQQRHQRIDNEEFDSGKHLARHLSALPRLESPLVFPDAEEQSEEESDDVETDPDEQEDHTTSRKPKTTSKKATKKRKSLFLDDEAGDTGDEGDGEVDDDNYESEEEEEINEDKESVESFSENVAETVARDRDDQGGEDDSSKNGDAKVSSRQIQSSDHRCHALSHLGSFAVTKSGSQEPSDRCSPRLLAGATRIPGAPNHRRVDRPLFRSLWPDGCLAQPLQR